MCQIYLITSKSRWHTIAALTDALQVDLNTAAAQTFPVEKYCMLLDRLGASYTYIFTKGDDSYSTSQNMLVVNDSP